MNPPYVSTERLYLDKDGNVVKQGDPTFDQRVSLLVGKNGTIPGDVAVKHGLMEGETPEPEFTPTEIDTKAVVGAPENKAILTPDQTKLAADEAAVAADKAAAAVAPVVLVK